MTTLNNLYHQLDSLDRTELQEVRRYIDQRIEEPSVEDERIEAKVKALQDAVENFWEGVPQEEIDEIVEAMNSEYIEPLSKYDRLDEKDAS